MTTNNLAEFLPPLSGKFCFQIDKAVTLGLILRGGGGGRFWVGTHRLQGDLWKSPADAPSRVPKLSVKRQASVPRICMDKKRHNMHSHSPVGLGSRGPLPIADTNTKRGWAVCSGTDKGTLLLVAY